MRLWSIHPRYLDRQGLTALWREALLARAVLLGRTRGYLRHPQLDRFREQADPAASIDTYLAAVHAEAVRRGYAFDPAKFTPAAAGPIAVSTGQLAFEWAHLMGKLAERSPAVAERWRAEGEPQCHPLFHPRPGPVEAWERTRPDSRNAS